MGGESGLDKRDSGWGDEVGILEGVRKVGIFLPQVNSNEALVFCGPRPWYSLTLQFHCDTILKSNRKGGNIVSDVMVLFDRSLNNVPVTIRQDHIDQIQKVAKGKVYWYSSEKEALADNVDAEVLFTWVGTGRPPDDYCMGSSKLKWIHSFSAGVNAILNSPVKELPIVLTNAKGIHGRTMSVVTIGYIISMVRGFPKYVKAQQEHIWLKHDGEMPRDIWGMTLCVVGAGAIGLDLARLAKALDMRVTGVKRSVQPLENFDKVYPLEQIDEALSEADVVVVLAPATPETYHMIDADRFKSMKPSSLFISISRGSVVDEAALIDALRNGEIAGAALDTVENEPLSPDSPLWDMENVIITPHCSANRLTYIDDAISQFCELLQLYESGQPLFNEVSL